MKGRKFHPTIKKAPERGRSTVDPLESPRSIHRYGRSQVRLTGYGGTGRGFGEGDVRKRAVRAPSTRVNLPSSGNRRRLLLRDTACIFAANSVS